MKGKITDTYIIAIVAVNSQGTTSYNTIRYYIWDLDTGKSCQYYVTLPYYSELGDVDGALETATNDESVANNVQYTLNDFHAYDYNYQPVYLPSCYNITANINNNIDQGNHILFNRYNDPVYNISADGNCSATLVQWKELDFEKLIEEWKK
jgi:hypothetical protein